MKTIYSDLLDTVRTPKTEDVSSTASEEFRLANATLMLSVVLEETPTLSQTMGSDSGLILDTVMGAHGDSFLSLVREDKIQFKVMPDTKDLMAAFRKSVSRGLDDGQDGFIFSGWPSIPNLDRTGGDSESIGLAIDSRKRFEGFLEDPSKESLLSNEEGDRIEALRRLNDAAMASGRKATSPSPWKLGDIVSKAHALSSLDNMGSYYNKLASLPDKDRNNRSKLYLEIEGMDAPDSAKLEMREFVDNAYNAIVADSLGAKGINLTQTTLLPRVTVDQCVNMTAEVRTPFTVQDVKYLNPMDWGHVEQFLTRTGGVDLNGLVQAEFLASVSGFKLGGVAIRPSVLNYAPLAVPVIKETLNQLAGIFIPHNQVVNQSLSAFGQTNKLGSVSYESIRGYLVEKYLGMIIRRSR